jgi:2-haloacid dehalogenase
MTIKAVIFDIGNVLIEWQPERRMAERIGAPRAAALFEAFDVHAMMTRIDSGGDFATVIHETAAAHPDWRDEIALFHSHWTEIAQPQIPHSVRLLRALRARRVPVFALTNFGAANFPLSVAQFPFLAEFDRHYISGEMGLAKPDPAIYAAVEADCGLAPESLLFADDRDDNIAAAAARGWKTHLFADPADWAQTLIDYGLLTKDEAA